MTPRRLPRPSPSPSGFTLVELVVVVGIIGVMIALLLPALAAARSYGKAICCASHLRQFGVATAAYTADHGERMPYVDTALWDASSPFLQDWDADPTDTTRYPHGWVAVMGPYLNNITRLRCPDAVAGYPRQAPVVTYRIASADNSDGLPRNNAQLTLPDGTVAYEYPFKYYNGRPYRVETVEAGIATGGLGLPVTRWRVSPRRGLYYLVRDFIHETNGRRHTPHQGDVNQLYIDLSVEAFHSDEAGHAFSDDVRGN